MNPCLFLQLFFKAIIVSFLFLFSSLCIISSSQSFNTDSELLCLLLKMLQMWISKNPTVLYNSCIINSIDEHISNLKSYQDIKFFLSILSRLIQLGVPINQNTLSQIESAYNTLQAGIRKTHPQDTFDLDSIQNSLNEVKRCNNAKLAEIQKARIEFQAESLQNDEEKVGDLRRRETSPDSFLCYKSQDSLFIPITRTQVCVHFSPLLLLTSSFHLSSI